MATERGRAKTGLPQKETPPFPSTPHPTTPTSAATTTWRARPPLPTISGCLRLVSSFLQNDAVLVRCMASGSLIRPGGRHQRGVDCQLGTSPQQESASDNFQPPTIQLIEHTKIEVAHFDVGPNPGGNLTANPCHHRVPSGSKSRPRTR